MTDQFVELAEDDLLALDGGAVLTLTLGSRFNLVLNLPQAVDNAIQGFSFVVAPKVSSLWLPFTFSLATS
ncbi:MAG: hypothetical protein FWF75_01155 [Propionibacteriaceae bacterium]|nr:hypothetical protein [Propionibacteriaceae bacterium]